MKHTVLGGALAALTLLAVPATAAAAAPAPKPIKLASAKVTIAPPHVQTGACDGGSQLDCGTVTVDARFSGLAAYGRPAEPGYPGDGQLRGSIRVVRTYGCATPAGKRLKDHDRTVRETALLTPRRAQGYHLPAQGVDVMDATAYAFLLDGQPGNCPAGTRAMTYSVRVGQVKLEVDSMWDGLPDSKHTAERQARAGWWGAVPAPAGEDGDTSEPPAPEAAAA